jgi:excisionase family DNA binding protein
MIDQEWLTLDEGAKYLRISRATLDRWIAEERVRAYELPSGRGRRVKRDDLDDVLVQRRLSLTELQPKMAEFAVYNAGNAEFREIAVMVRDASAAQGAWPLQIVERSLSKAEASNPPTTFRGRLIRQARLALLEYVHRREARAPS